MMTSTLATVICTTVILGSTIELFAVRMGIITLSEEHDEDAFSASPGSEGSFVIWPSSPVRHNFYKDVAHTCNSVLHNVVDAYRENVAPHLPDALHGPSDAAASDYLDMSPVFVHTTTRCLVKRPSKTDMSSRRADRIPELAQPLLKRSQV